MGPLGEWVSGSQEKQNSWRTPSSSAVHKDDLSQSLGAHRRSVPIRDASLKDRRSFWRPHQQSTHNQADDFIRRDSSRWLEHIWAVRTASAINHRKRSESMAFSAEFCCDCGEATTTATLLLVAAVDWREGWTRATTYSAARSHAPTLSTTFYVLPRNAVRFKTISIAGREVLGWTVSSRETPLQMEKAELGSEGAAEKLRDRIDLRVRYWMGRRPSVRPQESPRVITPLPSMGRAIRIQNSKGAAHSW